MMSGAVLAAVVATSSLTGCAAGMSRLKSSVNGQPGTISMPDLFRMSKAKAISTLKLAGHTGSVSWDDQLCGSVIDGQIIEKGEVCKQSPAAGKPLPAAASVRLLVQPEDPRHGKVGQHGEWHLMPAVVGLPLDEAKKAMHAAGFTDERTHIDESDASECKPNIVCRTYPAALERAGQQSDRYLTVGVDPAARAARQPTPERTSPTPPPSGETPPAPPPAEKPPESYF